MTLNHLETNSTKLAHYRLKIRKVTEFFYFQFLMQDPLYEMRSEAVLFTLSSNFGSFDSLWTVA